MEELFNFIQTLIAQGMPELMGVDEDYGQLETGQDTYPVTFPCVLIAAPEASWENLGDIQQKGKCVITTRLAIDCYDDTHYTSGTADKVAERQRMATKVHRLLQGTKVGNNGKLVRRKSRSYTLPGFIKVYEADYEIMVLDLAHP